MQWQGDRGGANKVLRAIHWGAQGQNAMFVPILCRARLAAVHIRVLFGEDLGPMCLAASADAELDVRVARLNGARWRSRADRVALGNPRVAPVARGDLEAVALERLDRLIPREIRHFGDHRPT